MDEKLNANAGCGATIIRRPDYAEQGNAHGVYRAICRDQFGNFKWEDEIHNVIMNEGKNYLLDCGFTNRAFIANCMNLITVSSFGTPASTDTYASHGSFTEVASTITAARVAISTWGNAGSGTKATTTGVSFTILGSPTNTDTVVGCCVFVTATLTTRDVTSSANNILMSAGTFTGGNRPVQGGDTVAVTYTFSI